MRPIRFCALWLVAISLSTPSIPTIAQTPKATENPDPKAKSLLDRVRSQYNTYKSMEASFTLTIELADQKPEVQKGTIAQQGDKYRLELSDKTIICDGATVWFHNKRNKEVQINTASAGSTGFLSPRELMRIHERKDFVYAISSEGVDNGRPCFFVEFKPTSRNSEYSKLRLSVDKRNNEIIAVKAFGKDGSRYTMLIDELIPNKNYPVNTFSFDKSKHPGVKIEDLRVD
jgi:outer membrane lipoprotein-sorting protein